MHLCYTTTWDSGIGSKHLRRLLIFCRPLVVITNEGNQWARINSSAFRHLPHCISNRNYLNDFFFFYLKQRYMKKKVLLHQSHSGKLLLWIGVHRRPSSVVRCLLSVDIIFSRNTGSIFTKGWGSKASVTGPSIHVFIRNKNIFFRNLHDILFILCTICFIACIVHHSI